MPGRKWWTAALVIQFWHHIEHALLQGQVLVGHNLFGSPIPLSFLQIAFPTSRVEIHLFYNAVVFAPMVVACPGCGRTTSSYFQELAQKIQSHLRHRMPEWRKRYPGVEEMTVAVMGCVVNGPGESKHANIGISLPGTGERPVAPVYIDGEKGPTLKGDRIAEEFQQLVEEYVARTYGNAREERSA